MPIAHPQQQQQQDISSSQQTLWLLGGLLLPFWTLIAWFITYNSRASAERSGWGPAAASASRAAWKGFAIRIAAAFVLVMVLVIAAMASR